VLHLEVETRRAKLVGMRGHLGIDAVPVRCDAYRAVTTGQADRVCILCFLRERQPLQQHLLGELQCLADRCGRHAFVLHPFSPSMRDVLPAARSARSSSVARTPFIMRSVPSAPLTRCVGTAVMPRRAASACCATTCAVYLSTSSAIRNA